MQYTVKYISNKCSQTDDLANKPHESVARSLMTILRDHSEIKHPVIGIEGSWGSGKSQVINILQKMALEEQTDKKYLFHTYDIWSTQEDLTRRSFLDSLLNFATDNDNKQGFKDSKTNLENLSKLNATTTIHSTKTFPVVRLFYGIALLIPVTLFIITMIEKLFGYRDGASLTYDQLRACCSLFLTGATIFFFIKDLISEYKTVSKEDYDNKSSGWDRFKTSLSRILYLYKGKDIEKEDHETIIKDEPSVSRFRKIFNDLKSSIIDDTVLVIVFDNMDRLSDSSKLMSVWTLLHTFFAESNNEGKIWAIVPYDMQQLSTIMATGEQEDKELITTEFINKTFFTSIHIPEPIMTSWKQFLNDKLDEAFTPAIEPEERVAVSLIFSRTSKSIMRPRDIIAFVNRLVTLNTQHDFEEIPVSVLALYSQFESTFGKDTTDVILNHKGYEQFLPLFVSRTQLSKQLAALYYNIKAEDAMEVVLGGSITSFLSSDFETEAEYDKEYQKLSNNSAYSTYIEEYFNNPNLALEDLKPDNLFYLLKQDNISKKTKARIYVLVAESVDSKFKTDFSCYQPWMEWALINCNLKNSNQIIASILKLSFSEFTDYQESLVNLLLLKEKRSELVINPQYFAVSKVDEILELIETLDSYDALRLYPQCKITVDCEKLLEFMKEGASAQHLFGVNTDKVFDLLKVLVNNKYNFKPIIDYISSATVNIALLDEPSVNRIYKVFDIINPVITSVPSFTAYNLGFKQIPEYYASCIYVVKNSDANVINTCFNTSYDPEKLIPILSRYVTLEDMFTMALKINNENLYSMCRDMVVSDNVRLGNLSIHFNKTSEITTVLTDEFTDSYISLLDNKSEGITFDKLFNINSYWIETITLELVNTHPIFARIHTLWVEGLLSLSAEQWVTNLNCSSSEYSVIVKTLDERELLPDTTYKSQELLNAMQSSLSEYIILGTNFDTQLYDLWKKHSTKVSLAIIANRIKDKITAPNSIPIDRFVIFFYLFFNNSERLKDKNNADNFFDDYLSRYYRECPVESKAQFTIDNKKKIKSFIGLCSEDRQEQFKASLQVIHDTINEGLPVKEKIKAIVDDL